MEAGSRLGDFVRWMAERNVDWNQQVITFEAPPGQSTAGTGVWSKDQAVLEDEVLCRIPKSALLSIRTSRIADLLEEQHINGGLGLTIAVAYERASGAASPWCKYLDFLPPREFLPLFWDDALLDLCTSTEVDVARVHADLIALREDYGEVRDVMQRHPDRFTDAHISFDSFVQAAAWVSSRAFYVDDSHGISMVPLADVFNHKASVVSLTDTHGYDIAELMAADNIGDSDSDGDGDEGNLSESAAGSGEDHIGQNGVNDSNPNKRRCLQLDNGEAAAQKRGADCKVLCQDKEGVARVAEDSHDDGSSGSEALSDVAEDEEGMPADEEAYLASFPSDTDFKLEIIIREQHDEGEDDQEALQILAAQEVAPHAEVHNTYGEHSNAELLFKYGFALAAPNPFDAVTLQLADVRLTAQKRCTDSVAVLGDVLAIIPGLESSPSEGGEDEPGEALELFHNGFIGGALAVLLLAVHLRLARAEVTLQDVFARLQVLLGAVDAEADAHALGEWKVGKVPLAKVAPELKGVALSILSDMLNERLEQLQTCITRLHAVSVPDLRAACSSKQCSEAECSTAVTGIKLCAAAEQAICEEALAEMR